jgi:hypothetical protein
MSPFLFLLLGCVHPRYTEAECNGLNLLSNKAHFIKKIKAELQKVFFENLF